MFIMRISRMIAKLTYAHIANHHSDCSLIKLGGNNG